MHSESNSKNFTFSNEVRAVFSFLEKEYNFLFTATENIDTAKFEKKNLIIEFRRFSGHDPTVYFMNISFNYEGKEMEFADLISMENSTLTQFEIEALTASRNYSATTLEDTQNSLSLMADLIRKYSYKLLGKR